LKKKEKEKNKREVGGIFEKYHTLEENFYILEKKNTDIMLYPYIYIYIYILEHPRFFRGSQFSFSSGF
jgi:hypothetical protein